MSRESDIQRRIDSLAERRAGLRDSISQYTNQVSTLTSQLDAKDQAIRAAEEFKTNSLQPLAKANEDFDKSLNSTGGMLSQALGGESSVVEALRKLNSQGSERIGNAISACERLIERLRRERGNLSSQLTSANNNLSTARSNVQSVQNTINDLYREMRD